MKDFRNEKQALLFPDGFSRLGCLLKSRAGQERIVTSPLEPSTLSLWPVLMTALAEPVAVTAGSPYSRQTIAACDIIPPMSVTVALILLNTGAQLGAVTGVTRISPSLI